jgi:hypothetical protein
MLQILYIYCIVNKYEVNEYRICWFSRFGFQGEKHICNVCIFHCIKAIIGFRVTSLWSRVLIGTMISLVVVEDLWY